MTSFFHAYDLRGTYPDEIDELKAEKVGRAYGSYVEGEVMVGRDGRTHGKKITEAFIDGILSTGTDVVDVGMVPTPIVYFGMVENDVPYSAVVTASHNPSEYTGFKFCGPDALAMSREGGMAEIEEIYDTGEFESGNGRLRTMELREQYVEFVRDKIELEEELDVVVNFGNGVTSVVGRELLEALGCNVEGINEKIDGKFPNHLPDPGDQQAQEMVVESMGDNDIGIIFDGDGDRAGVILPGTGYVKPDEMMALLAEEALMRGKGKVAHDLRASKLVKETVRSNGGTPIESRVGHTFVSEMIHEDSEIVFAGELSGHFYYPVYGIPWDDGLFSAALFCQMVAERDVEAEINGFEDYPVSPELRIDCPHHAKPRVIEKLADHYSDHELSTIDGVKVEFEKGWALVRPSNTEEKMSVRCEADTEEALEEITSEVEGLVREFIQDST